LAFAAVFFTAANALGSSNAMRASFIVDLRDDALRDSTWKMPAAYLCKLAGGVARNSQRRARQQLVVCRSDGVILALG